MNDTATLPVTDTETTAEEDDVAHWILELPGSRTMLEAFVYGLPVKALCGVIFIPHRDPDHLPRCEACEEIKRAIEQEWDVS